jgi:hypothetical protein
MRQCDFTFKALADTLGDANGARVLRQDETAEMRTIEVGERVRDAAVYQPLRFQDGVHGALVYAGYLVAAEGAAKTLT